LLLCSSYLPLGVPNWAVIYTPSTAIVRPGRSGSRVSPGVARTREHSSIATWRLRVDASMKEMALNTIIDCFEGSRVSPGGNLVGEIHPAKPGTAEESTSSGALTAWSREAATPSSRATALESTQRRRPAECRRRGAAPHTAEPRTPPSHRDLPRRDAMAWHRAHRRTHAGEGGVPPLLATPRLCLVMPRDSGERGEEGRVGAGWWRVRVPPSRRRPRGEGERRGGRILLF
jgi:hypothetical protein